MSLRMVTAELDDMIEEVRLSVDSGVREKRRVLGTRLYSPYTDTSTKQISSILVLGKVTAGFWLLSPTCSSDHALYMKFSALENFLLGDPNHLECLDD